MVWSEAEAVYAIQSIREDANHPAGGRIAGECKADAFGAEHQSQYFLQMLPAVSNGTRKVVLMLWPTDTVRPGSPGMRYHPGKKGR